MAKKTIISDFSALKGKVTFSEKTYDTKMSPKVTPATATPKPKDSNDGLKIGQSVVLMDSNLRGKIVGLVELERLGFGRRPSIVLTLTKHHPTLADEPTL